MQDPPDPWQFEDATQRIRTWAGPTRLAVVNKGHGKGFMVCPRCGRSEPKGGKSARPSRLMKNDRPINHKHPLESGVMCTGVAVGPFHLGYQFPTDVLLMRLRAEEPLRLGMANQPRLLSQASRIALTALIESILLAATRELQIDDSELSGWWTPIKGAPVNEAQIYLYDQLAGGAGYARTVQSSLATVLESTEKLLLGCDCAQSCYKCIRHYGNNSIHALLDRRLALDLLRHLRTGDVPAITAASKQAALNRLTSYLKLFNVQFMTEYRPSGAPQQLDLKIPLIINPRSGKGSGKGSAQRQEENSSLPEAILIDVHHPLVDPELIPSPVRDFGRRKGLPVIELDAFELLHNLPAALGRLEQVGGLPIGPGTGR
ncbi:MAG: DUF1998 domain-containing protein [Acidobacteriota bacterium]